METAKYQLDLQVSLTLKLGRLRRADGQVFIGGYLEYWQQPVQIRRFQFLWLFPTRLHGMLEFGDCFEDGHSIFLEMGYHIINNAGRVEVGHFRQRYEGTLQLAVAELCTGAKSVGHGPHHHHEAVV